MMDDLTAEKLRANLRVSPEPMRGLWEDDHWIGMAGRPLSIHKREPRFSVGWVLSLRPTSRFYKTWFDVPDLGKRGWAIVFRLADEPMEPGENLLFFGGWVPPEREADVDGWVERLNNEIRDRLAGETPPAARAESPTLTWVGDFREMGYGHHANAPSLAEAKGRRTASHKAEVLTYLRKAPSISFSPGFEADFFDPTRHVKGHTIRTDGVYLWPDFVADYVERYDVALPDWFEQHMEQRQWRLPESLDVRTLRPPW